MKMMSLNDLQRQTNVGINSIKKWLQEFFGAHFLKGKIGFFGSLFFLSPVIVEVLCHFHQRL